MKFDKHLPVEALRSYIKYFVVSENEWENEYKVFPSSQLVMGFQYKGQLANIKAGAINSVARGLLMCPNEPVNTTFIFFLFFDDAKLHRIQKTDLAKSTFVVAKNEIVLCRWLQV